MESLELSHRVLKTVQVHRVHSLASPFDFWRWVHLIYTLTEVFNSQCGTKRDVVYRTQVESAVVFKLSTAVDSSGV